MYQERNFTENDFINKHLNRIRFPDEENNIITMQIELMEEDTIVLHTVNNIENRYTITRLSERCDECRGCGFSMFGRYNPMVKIENITIGVSYFLYIHQIKVLLYLILTS
jgi:hypothetical protein